MNATPLSAQGTTHAFDWSARTAQCVLALPFTEGMPSAAKASAMTAWIRANADRYARRYVKMYHATHASLPIEEVGLLPTSARRRRSFQSAPGYVYLVNTPERAKNFGDLGSQGKSVVYEVLVLVSGPACQPAICRAYHRGKHWRVDRLWRRRQGQGQGRALGYPPMARPAAQLVGERAGLGSRGRAIASAMIHRCKYGSILKKLPSRLKACTRRRGKRVQPRQENTSPSADSGVRTEPAISPRTQATHRPASPNLPQ